MTAQNTTTSHVLAPTTAKTVTWALAGLGIAVLMAVVANKASGGAIFAAKPAPVAAATATPTGGARAILVIESTVPDATVIFRGVNHSAPHNEEVTESESNETIEVTAPGHEGRRFWLKVDRPRTMHVDLPVGSGLVDATFGETLVALGEQVATVDEPSSARPGTNDTRPTGGGGGWHRGPTTSHVAAPGSAVATTTQTAEPIQPPPTTPATASAAATVKLDREDPWGTKRSADAGK